MIWAPVFLPTLHKSSRVLVKKKKKIVIQILPYYVTEMKWENFKIIFYEPFKVIKVVKPTVEAAI